MFQRYVASVSYGCCKSRSECCNGCTRMLQAPVLNISFVFFGRKLQVCLSGCCICFHTYDASILSGCCICLQWFQVFLGVFVSVSDICFKCFICFQTYVAIVAFECFKTKSIVASPFVAFLLSRLGVRRGMRRQSLLARAGLTCLWADAASETWTARRGTRDLGQRRMCLDGGRISMSGR
jgi:hypothetical protein